MKVSGDNNYTIKNLSATQPHQEFHEALLGNHLHLIHTCLFLGDFLSNNAHFGNTITFSVFLDNLLDACFGLPCVLVHPIVFLC